MTGYSQARLGLALALTMGAAFLGAWPGQAAWWAPIPLVTTVPIALLVFRVGAPLTVSVAAALLLGPLILLGWAPFVTRREVSQVPKRSQIGFLLLTVLDGLWIAISYRTGEQYRGHNLVLATLALHVVVLALCGFLLIRACSKPSWGRNLSFHASVVVWLCWCAFPYFGELP